MNKRGESWAVGESSGKENRRGKEERKNKAHVKGLGRKKKSMEVQLCVV